LGVVSTDHAPETCMGRTGVGLIKENICGRTSISAAPLHLRMTELAYDLGLPSGEAILVSDAPLDHLPSIFT